MASSEYSRSVLIIGSGVFGLSTALSLAKNPKFSCTRITLVDRSKFPAPDGASVDISRLIRADYADASYSCLALAARAKWRGEYGANGRYHETGLLLTSSREHAQYVNSAYENVIALEDVERAQGIRPAGVSKLESKAAIIKMNKTGNCSGDQGYINHGSGWADAEMAMRYMRSTLRAMNRVELVTGTVERLLFADDRGSVIGAALANGSEIMAEMTVLAAGAWSGSLLDLRGLVTASGQILSYLEISQEEQEWLSRCPPQINMSTGMFIIPPAPPASITRSICEASRHSYLKVARHGFGYANPVEILNPEIEKGAESMIVSLPHTESSPPYAAQQVPAEGLAACRAALHEFFPSDPATLHPDAPETLTSIPSRDFAFARLCHYSDTPTGNFLIDYHPKYNRSLFVATGGSGHGFKFAPVIGDHIVDAILGQYSDDFREKWAWPSAEDAAKARKETVEEGGDGWAIDGSRGDRRGMILKDELVKSVGCMRTNADVTS